MPPSSNPIDNEKYRSIVSLRTIEKVAKQAQLNSSYLVFMATSGVLAAVGASHFSTKHKYLN